MIKQITIIERVNVILALVTFFLAFVSMGTLWIPVRKFGMPLYSILLVSHSVSFWCISIVRYQVLPSLADETYTNTKLPTVFIGPFLSLVEIHVRHKLPDSCSGEK